MENVWVELRYGLGPGICICRADDPYLLQVFRRCAITRGNQKYEQSHGVDEVINLIDLFDTQKLKGLLDMVIPENQEEG